MNKTTNNISQIQKAPSPLERAGVRLKVCGMKYPDNIKAVADLQPNYLGFIFYEKSARHFEGDIPKLSDSIKKVGVFVDANLVEVIKTIKKHKLQAVQLHGDESPEFCNDLKSHFEQSEKSHKVEVIKVFSIKDDFNFQVLKPYESVCDYYLFDTKGKLPGGNGYSFDWNVLNNYPSTKPYFLSGGIGIDQINEIKKFKQSKASKYCYAIDVNSRFEIEPGLKDIEKLKEFKNKLITSSDF